MTTPPQKAYTKRYFNEHWREDADAVGVGDLNFHDNRGHSCDASSRPIHSDCRVQVLEFDACIGC